jgi:hypothetical protein
MQRERERKEEACSSNKCHQMREYLSEELKQVQAKYLGVREELRRAEESKARMLTYADEC